MKRLSALLVLVLVASVACGRPDEALADMQLREEFGTVVVVRDGEITQVVGTFGLEPGDLVVTRKDSAATFALEGGDTVRRIELGSESQVMVEGPTSIDARQGRVLVTANGEPLNARFDGVRATTSAAVFRIDRGFGSARAGVYNGRVSLAAPGQTRLRVDEFFEATVVAGDVPGLTQPYQMDVRDEWDAEHLGPYFELETQLRDLATGFTNQVGSQRPGLDYFSALAEGRTVGFLQPYLKRRPADLLIGFVVARNSEYELREGFTTAFEYYDAGARWGIVAAIMRVDTSPILGQLEQLILGTGVANNDGGEAEFTVAAAELGSGSTSATDSSSGGSNDPSVGEDPGGGEDPKKPDDDDDPPEECSDGAECDINDLAEDILGDEEEDPPPQPGPSPTEEEDGLLEGEGGLFD